MKKQDKWQTLKDSMGYSDLERMKVPGGWILRTYGIGRQDGVAICFYPDSLHSWENNDKE